VCLVKDEADVIERTITHMLGQVDRVVAVDNGSTDGTREILASLPIEVRDDPDPRHYQARKVTALAIDTGGKYVVPFDADEIWYSTSREPIATVIRRNARKTWVFTAELLEHVPTEGMHGDHPFDRMRYRRRTVNPLLKVACRVMPFMQFSEGYHSVTYHGQYAATRPFKLEVRHFPYRSPNQFISKVRNGYNGRKAAADLPEEVSPHLRGFGRMLESGGEEALAEYFWSNIWREPDDPELIADPCPA